jgi:3'(2'), 5'-bisphosphate nucleotidase
VVYERERQIALEAVAEAAKLCAAVRAEMVSAQALEKGDRSPVTIADFGSQAVVCRRLLTAFPHDQIVAEEDAGDLRKAENALQLTQVTQYVQRCEAAATPERVCEWIDAGKGSVAQRFWTLDPIDGTKGFLRHEQFAIALALIEDGRVQVGALACPNLPIDMAQPSGQHGVVFWAVRGGGAEMVSLNGGKSLPISVSSVSDPAGARFVESVEAGHTDHDAHASLARSLGITRPSLRLDSQAKYGVVARGDSAIYLRLPSPKTPDYRERIWDHAAGVLIVEEAGGRVTDAYGRELDFGQGPRLLNNQGIVVSNGQFHSDILEAIAQQL